MINRYKLIKKHNIILYEPAYDSPLSVGNGEFVFTADVTGVQTLYEEYRDAFPLCTMGNFGWHTESDHGRVYSLKDLEMTSYKREGRTFRYPVKKTEKNEKVYDWLRKNPHKINLYRLGFRVNGRRISSGQITEVHQELDLYTGILNSSFQVDKEAVKVQTVCSGNSNRLGLRIEAGESLKKNMSLELEFPYGSPDITGSDWTSPSRHGSYLVSLGEKRYLINRVMDDLLYQVMIELDGAQMIQEEEHRFSIRFDAAKAEITILTDRAVPRQFATFNKCCEESEVFWRDYWENTGLIDFGETQDTRAHELERREILSLYLLRLQCAGSLPPAETGLSCNSWYGKFHLEMHFWHSAFLPAYSQGRLLEKSFEWYIEHRDEAKENEERNGYKGIRWPKMVGCDGEDSPSPIAPLLIWQQPHIIFMLELLYQSEPSEELVEKYYGIVRETADFMADFAEWNSEKNVYELRPPLIPVQETHDPETTLNPVFELEYWREALNIADEWAKRSGRKGNSRWGMVSEAMALPASAEGVYLTHENGADTYINHAKDHPSMLMACGILRGDRLDRETVERTLQKVLEVWDFNTAWGWDFAVMAMTAVRLDLGDLAVDILLKDTQKNEYVLNGHNKQGYRKDLPLYLPGNGSFLYALAMMAAGYRGCGKKMPGFPENWTVRAEGIKALY